MGLDIRLVSAPSRGTSAPALVFEDDGYYWFLHPLFERLREETGKYIDLYGGALFSRNDWPRLRALLREAEAMANRQPVKWEVCVGTQLHPVEKKLYRAVVRDELLQRIATFKTLIDVAEGCDGVIECLGD
jgi:hypothetical protein